MKDGTQVAGAWSTPAFIHKSGGWGSRRRPSATHLHCYHHHHYYHHYYH